MSSLIFVTEKEQVLTATDTLATSQDGKPFMFTTKAFIVPHIQMIMCGTGINGFLTRWFVEVNDRMVVRGIENLNYHTPHILQSLQQKYNQEYSLPDNITTTVYHFGFSEDDGFIHAYAYRSASNFTSETLEYGIGVKPESGPLENVEIPKDVKKIMDKQRAIQATRPKNERVYIGGKIQIVHLTNLGFAVHTLDQFDDYEKIQNEIFSNFDSSNRYAD